MYKKISKLLSLALAAFMLASCAGEAPTEQVDVVMTAAIHTMVASFFETQTALVTPVTETATSTQTPFPTVTPFPSATTVFASPTFV